MVQLLLVLVVSFSAVAPADGSPLVIAHRGASGYLPEHTLEAKALAYGMGADFIEQDVVLTKDRQAIVLHDIYLDTVTDVAERFPERARADGRFYALDFMLDEIKTLRVHERANLEDQQRVYPGRFPLGRSRFEIATLAEEIELIQGLNQSTGRNVGIYPEIKKPAWHRQQGYDISPIVLATLKEYGYDSKDDKVFLQCFDPVETKRLHDELHAPVRLVQLIADNEWDEANVDFDTLRTAAGIAKIATYADGIGPWIPHIYEGRSGGHAEISNLVELAHRHGLVVHCFTFRLDDLPEGIESFDELLEIFGKAGVDGVFSDFPDRCVEFYEESSE